MKKLFLIFLIFFTFLNSGCDNGLDIVSEYKEQLAVFLILDSRSDKHIIKVQKVQKSYGVPSVEKLVDPVSVRILDPLGYSRTFKDTVINTVSNFNSLYIDSLDLTEGVYQLFVNARDSLYASSSIVVYQRPKFFVIPPAPGSIDSLILYFLYITTPQLAYTRITPYLLYTIKQNSEFVEKRIAVQSFYSMRRIPRSPELNPYRLPIPKSHVQDLKNKLINDFGSENIRFNGIQFIFYTYSMDLYKYISLHGYADNYSVRLDEPNHTNIVGGMGIFGAAYVDVITVGDY